MVSESPGAPAYISYATTANSGCCRSERISCAPPETCVPRALPVVCRRDVVILPHAPARVSILLELHALTPCLTCSTGLLTSPPITHHNLTSSPVRVLAATRPALCLPSVVSIGARASICCSTHRTGRRLLLITCGLPPRYVRHRHPRLRAVDTACGSTSATSESIKRGAPPYLPLLQVA